MSLSLQDSILQGDCVSVLRTLPAGIAHTCITSPPYWNLRDYGVDGQIGLEATPDEWCRRIVDVFREVRRVLRDDGTLWVNLGDTYFGDSPTRTKSSEAFSETGDTAQTRSRGGKRRSAARLGDLKPKDLVGIPWMVAFALRADGWYLRSDIVWAMSNPMPESCTDRPTKSHEYIFLLSKSPRYYYDAAAIREGVTGGAHPRVAGRNSRKHVDRDPAHIYTKMPDGWESGKGAHGSYHREGREKGRRVELTPGVTPKSALPGRGIKANTSFHAACVDLVNTRNKRSVWTVATSPWKEAHFATFPPRLIEPCVLAGAPPRTCERCAAPWRRVTENTPMEVRSGPKSGHYGSRTTDHLSGTMVHPPSVRTLGWEPTCECEGNSGAGKGLVLDPFMGAGTVGVVARRHSRHYLGIELNPAYIEMAERRIANERQPVLWSIA